MLHSVVALRANDNLTALSSSKLLLSCVLGNYCQYKHDMNNTSQSNQAGMPKVWCVILTMYLIVRLPVPFSLGIWG